MPGFAHTGQIDLASSRSDRSLLAFGQRTVQSYGKEVKNSPAIDCEQRFVQSYHLTPKVNIS
jgi:hypothetical protein